MIARAPPLNRERSLGKLIPMRCHRDSLNSDSFNPNPTENTPDGQIRGSSSLPPPEQLTEGDETSGGADGTQRDPLGSCLPG